MSTTRPGRIHIIETETSKNRTWSKWLITIPGYCFSAVFHLVLMFLLLHLTLPNSFQTIHELIFQPGMADTPGLDAIGMLDTNSLETNDFTQQWESSITQSTTSSAPTFSSEQLSDMYQSDTNIVSNTDDWALSGDTISATQSGGNAQGDGFAGRGTGKGQLLVRYGGSEGSEKAVALGLEWLAAHQNPDGSWSYNFQTCTKCKGRCKNPGRNGSLNSATALALLPFLGCGITHKQGNREYRQVVDKGLKFLLKNSKVQNEALNLMDVYDGGMYHQGLCSIVICEAAAMTQDPKLKVAAQRAVNFIQYAQIPSDGGWRYQPRDTSGGDTSVLGWQIMALKSGQMGGALVDDMVYFRAKRFLDTVVAMDKGAIYTYQGRRTAGDVSATTAIGLLSQMYMGWESSHPALVRGVGYLSDDGPDDGNLYYNYYATQVMHHFGGEKWEKWNMQQRDPLIAKQSLEGHERGSWYFRGKWNETGGRLYTTSLAIMILEVYYRHLPLYQQQAAYSEFPLD